MLRGLRTETDVSEVWHHVPNTTLLTSTRARIAQHYHFALSKAFANSSTTHVLIFEDDLLAAPDTLEYLYSTLPHLYATANSSVVCASAWNDNGRAAFLHPLSVTSFFPGLGWALSRPLWHALANTWPTAGIAPSAPATIGWDFWLRIVFEQRDWACITPSPPRTRHTGLGTNVGRAQMHMYTSAHTPDANATDLDWSRILPDHLDLNALAHRVQHRLTNGKLVATVQDAVSYADEQPVLPFYREDFQKLSDALGLWPTPRGHFRHTLHVGLPDRPGYDVLLFDVRRARPFFRLPVAPEEPAISALAAARNETCTKACTNAGLVCSAPALEALNDCRALSELFEHACNECAYETGGDLPAFVVHEAPLETKGSCLVTETGFTSDGRLDCDGQHEWTRRACACVPPLEDSDEKSEL